MTVYISGKIKGDDDYQNKFMHAECVLASRGYHPINPCVIGDELEKDLNRKPTYEEYMKEDCKALLNCSMVVMLPGWESSRGANQERMLAEWCGIKVREFNDLLQDSVIMRLN